MADIQVAAPPKKSVQPAFTVEKLAGKRKRSFILLGKDKDGNPTRRIDEREVDAGYMVKCMKGHSVHIWTKKDLKRLELDNTIPLVNEEGDEVGQVPNTLNEGE